MRCRKVKIRLLAFLDGEIGEEEKERIASHLKACQFCGEEAKALSSLWRLLDEGKESIKPSPYFWNKLERKIVEAKENQNVFKKLWEWLNKAFVPATATAVLVIGLFIGIQLGEAVYSSIARKLNPEGISLAHREVDESLQLNTLDDFPGESIGGVYYTLLAEGEFPEKR